MSIAASIAALSLLAPTNAPSTQGIQEGELDFRLAAEGVWIHTSCRSVPGYGPVPSNGLIARAAQGSIVVDPGFTPDDAAVFVDGVLVPNTELGKLFLAGQGDVAELYVADRVRTAEDLDWETYGRRLHEYFGQIDRLFTPDLVVVGGGVSKKHQKFLPEVDIRVPVVPAELRNQAGIVGAATAAAALLT